MKITDVVLTRIHGHFAGQVFPDGDRQARQLDIYPEFNTPAGSGMATGGALHALYVEIQTDEGVTGIFGPIEEWQAFHLYRSLRPYLIGRDPLAGELLYDQMIRLDRHGRSGMFMTAISAVDCALWDLAARRGANQFIGYWVGQRGNAVPAYASMLGFATNPAAAAERATEYKTLGYAAQKWFFRYGPGDGAAGMEQNLAMASAVREAVGPHYTLMFDAFMGWDVTYAVKMVRALAPLHPTWMEEPVPPERVGELRKIRQAADVPIATGEHVYTRWQTKELLVNEAVDVLQNDPDWTGGITEQVKLCALASAFEVPVIAHGHSLLPALHVAAAQSPATVPLVEYLIRYQVTKQFFHQPIYQPEGGSIVLPTLPGLGLVVDATKVERQENVAY